MAVTNPGDIAVVITSTWLDFELSDAQERLYAEYLKDIDPDVLRGCARCPCRRLGPPGSTGHH
jgi:hypothetical protein